MGSSILLDNGLRQFVDVLRQSKMESPTPGGAVYVASEGKLFFVFVVQFWNTSDKPIAISFPSHLRLQTPIGSIEMPTQWGYLTELSEPYSILSIGQWFYGTLAPGQHLDGFAVIEAVNLLGTYYVIDDSGSTGRMVWGFVHDGLSHN